jgi:hypothetical protein
MAATQDLERQIQQTIATLEREYAARRRASAQGQRLMSASVARAYLMAIADETRKLEALQRRAALGGSMGPY